MALDLIECFSRLRPQVGRDLAKKLGLYLPEDGEQDRRLQWLLRAYEHGKLEELGREVQLAPQNEVKVAMYAWKRLSDGIIVQDYVANTADDLFEAAGFGAVNTEQPIKAFLAVQVEKIDGQLREVI